MSADIKLFVCCHKYENVPEHPLLVPIQVGAALAEQHFDGFLHDDTGENISAKNRSYCELTAQYWAWKNVEADYYGFFHYRRYLYPDTVKKNVYGIKKYPDLNSLESLGYSRFRELIEKNDVVLPLKENMHISVQEQYASAKYHREKDFVLVNNIIRELYPEYLLAMESYFAGTKQYFGNIFIMSKAQFKEYCEWLFTILEEFDRCCDTTGYCEQEIRVNGYLAERLLGVYIEKHRTKLKIQEVPRVYFEKGVQRIKKRMVNFLLPPESLLRFKIKTIIKRKE